MATNENSASPKKAIEGREMMRKRMMASALGALVLACSACAGGGGGGGATSGAQAPGDLASDVHALRQVAQQYNVPIVAKFDYLQTLPDWKTTLLSEDGVHPTDAGYEAIAEQEAKMLAPIVQSLLSH
ncbi:SGNH/GDSL hydrolase family protein [Paraburkholderia sacchari]|uniref:SGNH/GDSL hydrolase family protein n=1 Tax=Paraburkholderia sacchari TaxID=159450 RepID=UPI003D965FB0